MDILITDVLVLIMYLTAKGKIEKLRFTKINLYWSTKIVHVTHFCYVFNSSKIISEKKLITKIILKPFENDMNSLKYSIKIVLAIMRIYI